MSEAENGKNLLKTIVFDLDDTLIETGDVFRNVLFGLCERLELRLAGQCPTREEILGRQNDIDAELLGRKGAKPERFAMSLVSTYEEFMGRFELPFRTEDEDFLNREGYRAFQEIPKLSSDTLEVLDQLVHCELLLYTWGLETIQMPRIRALDLERYFASIHCVSAKHQQQFEEILGDRVRTETLMCGDSLKLDIAPAVAIGCHAAHVVRPEGWAFLQSGVEVTGHYHRLSRLGELIDVIQKIEGTNAEQSLALQG